jgi:hypothetical protein
MCAMSELTSTHGPAQSRLDTALTIWHSCCGGFTTQNARMKLWALTAATLVISGAWAAAVADAASCSTKSHGNCLSLPATVNFSSVPEISKQIVNEEPPAEKPNTRTLEAPPITTYTGPTAGFSSMARAPTVGYYWSLEPDNH